MIAPARGILVTGTDTDCGKTLIGLGLMAAWQARGERVLGMKPVATGCDPSPAGLRNGDALRLQAQCSHPVPYALVNPYAFAPPIAPHIAAARAGVEIALPAILDAYRALAAQSDRVVVEGVGGWRVPLSPRLALGDLAVALGLPVVLVVGLKLGCLNHALLAAESIRAQGAWLAGWVGNRIEPGMQAVEENLETLVRSINAPCIGVVPWIEGAGVAGVAGYLRPERLALPG